jgi:hydrogenase nickel incorporation protein HypA/HybF
MSLAESVMQIIEDAAAKQSFGCVKVVRLEVGELAGVESEALRFCFDAVTRGGIAEGCRLEIIAMPGEGWCLQCEAKTPLRRLFDACARCGSYRVRPVAGSEMRVRDLMVE